MCCQFMPNKGPFYGTEEEEEEEQYGVMIGIIDLFSQ